VRQAPRHSQGYAAHPQPERSGHWQSSHFAQPEGAMPRAKLQQAERTQGRPFEGMPENTQGLQRSGPSLAVPCLHGHLPMSRQEDAMQHLHQGQEQQFLQQPPVPQQRHVHQVQHRPYHQANGEWMSTQEMPPMDQACPAEWVGDRQDLLMVGGSQMRRTRSTWRQPQSTQTACPPELVGNKQDVVIGGQELRSGIPTPARARSPPKRTAMKESSVQTNRHSIDGHAAQAAREAALGSERSQAPRGEDRAAEATSHRSTRFRDLVYPVMADRVQPPSIDAPRGTPAALAQALSSAVGMELSALDEGWDLGAPSTEKRLEESVAGALKKICEKALRACVLKALRRPPAVIAEAAGSAAAAQEAQEASALELRCVQLEAEIAASEDRVQHLDSFQANAEQLLRRNRAPRECLQALLQQLAAEAEGHSDSYDAAGIEEGHDQCLQRLGLVDLWLYRTLTELQEAKADLKEREQVVASKAFAHLPEQTSSGQMALSRLP